MGMYQYLAMFTKRTLNHLFFFSRYKKDIRKCDYIFVGFLVIEMSILEITVYLINRICYRKTQFLQPFVGEL